MYHLQGPFSLLVMQLMPLVAQMRAQQINNIQTAATQETWYCHPQALFARVLHWGESAARVPMPKAASTSVHVTMCLSLRNEESTGVSRIELSELSTFPSPFWWEPFSIRDADAVVSFISFVVPIIPFIPIAVCVPLQM